MARSTGQYFSGVLPGVGSGQRLNFFNQLRTSLMAFLSAGVPAWEEYANRDGFLDAGVDATITRNRIFRSRGDRNLVGGVGDASLFFQFILRTDTFFYLNTMQDYSTLTHLSLRKSRTNLVFFFTLDDVTQIDFFGVRNEYEFTFIFIQGGSRFFFSIGSPVRNHIAPVTQGIAFSTGAVVAGAAVVIPVDRNLTATLQPGQLVWIYDVAATGVALPTDNMELAIVSAVAAASVTITTLANAHAANAIIGLDPSAMYIGLVAASASPTIHLTNRFDGTSTIDANTAVINPQNAGVVEADNDPAITNQYIGVTASMLPTAGVLGFRGNFQHLGFWPVGTQVDGDRMLPNFSVPLAQKIFPSLLNITHAVAIGPGAT